MTTCTASASRIWCVVQLHDRKGEGGKFGAVCLISGAGRWPSIGRIRADASGSLKLEGMSLILGMLLAGS